MDIQLRCQLEMQQLNDILCGNVLAILINVYWLPSYARVNNWLILLVQCVLFIIASFAQSAANFATLYANGNERITQQSKYIHICESVPEKTGEKLVLCHVELSAYGRWTPLLVPLFQTVTKWNGDLTDVEVWTQAYIILMSIGLR